MPDIDHSHAVLSEKHRAAAADRHEASGAVSLAGIWYESWRQRTEILTAGWSGRGAH
jgi:hypothetical protein